MLLQNKVAERLKSEKRNYRKNGSQVDILDEEKNINKYVENRF